MLQETTGLRELFSVQNRTEETSRSVEHYVQKFATLNRKASAGIIDLSATLVEAEGILDKAEFGSFCKEVGIARGNSFHKKLRTIGRNADRFQPHLNLLPNCWTTIYALAQLESDEFEKLVGNGILSSKMKAKDIQKFLGTSGKDSDCGRGPTNKKRSLVFSFNELNDDTKQQLASKITELAKTLNLSVSISGLKVGSEDTDVRDQVPVAA